MKTTKINMFFCTNNISQLKYPFGGKLDRFRLIVRVTFFCCRLKSENYAKQQIKKEMCSSVLLSKAKLGEKQIK